MKRIAVASIDNIHNFGDDILGTTTAWIIENFTDSEVIRMQFSPGKESELRTMPITFLASALLLHATGKLPESAMKHFIRNKGVKIRTYKYYSRMLSSCDGIVTAVGMFKFTSQDHSYLFNTLCETATKLNKPLCISAASICDKDETSILCNQLFDCFNYPALKMITTRDGIDGLRRLNDSLSEREIIRDYVGDPALWIPEVYSIIPPKNREVIGIGLLRKNIFQSYRGPNSISENRLIEVYIELIEEFKKRGIKWQLFCNGMAGDYNVGVEILERLGLPEDYLAKCPENAEDLINTISKYKAVVGGRFHSCLISYALDIPVIGMDWDNKLRCFFNSTNRAGYLVDEDHLDGEYIAETVLKAGEEKYDPSIRDDLKQRTKKYLVEFVNSIC